MGYKLMVCLMSSTATKIHHHLTLHCGVEYSADYCVSVDETWRCTSDDLPWLTRLADTALQRHSDPPAAVDSQSSDGPSLPSTAPPRQLHADTVVPPPGRAQSRLAPDPDSWRSAGTGPWIAGADPRRNGPSTAAGRRAVDKFDELDEEAMSPLSWRSPPDTVLIHTFTLDRLSSAAAFNSTLNRLFQIRSVTWRAIVFLTVQPSATRQGQCILCNILYACSTIRHGIVIN